MIIKMIEGCTRVLGKSQGYLGLPVLDYDLKDQATGRQTNVMASAWEPTPDEIAAIAAGAPVYLHVYGLSHPPVMITVGEAPDLPPSTRSQETT